MPTAGKFKHLQELVSWPEALEKLKDGADCPTVARFLIKSENLSEKESAITAHLRYFVKNNFLKRVPKKHLEFIEKNKNIDPLDAVNALFAIQMDLILEEFNRKEPDMDIINQTIKNGNDLIKTMAVLQSDTHKHKVALAKAQGTSSSKETVSDQDKIKEEFASQYGDKAASVLMNPNSRTKVLSLLNKVKAGTGSIKEMLRENEEEVERIRERNGE
jgi:hypothetical protein